MNAEPLLNKIAKSFADHRLEAVMVGSAAKETHGPPVDFLFRKTPTNLSKLKRIARELGAVIFKQYYPRADRFALMNDDMGWRVWLEARQNVRSFQAPSSRADTSLSRESERALIDQIRRLQALPMNKRTNFLRVRHPNGGSHL
jgi:hypothetical protein